MRRLLLLPCLLLLNPVAARAQASAPEPVPAAGQSPALAAPSGDLASPGTPVPAPAVEAPPAPVALNAQDPAPVASKTETPKHSGSSAPLKISYSSCTVEGQFAALTFDDGPHAQNTPRLLDILKQRGVKATFFVVGQNAAQYPEILKRIVAEGHELANHSYTHPVLNTLGEGGIREQLDKTHQAVLSATGVQMKLLRPPYGALTDNFRRWVHASFGYRTILWDVDPLDWKVRDAARVQGEIVRNARAGSIILAHDIHKSTVDAMPGTLDQLLEKGFKFVTVSELLAMHKPEAPKPAPAPKSTAAPSASKKNTTASGKSTSPSASKDQSKTGSVALKTSVPASSGTSSKPAASTASQAVATKKSAPLTKEELRKKWLEISNR